MEKKYGHADIIHCHYLPTALGHVLNGISRAPASIFHLHNRLVTNPLNQVPLAFVLKYGVTHVLAVSDYVRQDTLSKFPSLREKTSVMNNAVDIDEFDALVPGDEEIGLPAGCRMLFVGRIVPEKGLWYVIEAMAYLKKTGCLHDLQLIVIGPLGGFGASSGYESSYWHHITRRIEIEGLEDRVLFLGRVDRRKLISIYKMCDFLVVPSCWGEPSSTAVFESDACGKPVLAFADGGIPEIVKDGVTGFLVEVGNVYALAERIRILLGDQRKARIMGKTGKAKVLKHFSFPVVAERTAQLYEAFLIGN